MGLNEINFSNKPYQPKVIKLSNEIDKIWNA